MKGKKEDYVGEASQGKRDGLPAKPGKSELGRKNEASHVSHHQKAKEFARQKRNKGIPSGHHRRGRTKKKKTKITPSVEEKWAMPSNAPRRKGKAKGRMKESPVRGEKKKKGPPQSRRATHRIENEASWIGIKRGAAEGGKANTREKSQGFRIVNR